MNREDDLHEAYEQAYDDEHHAEVIDSAPTTSAG